MKILINIPSLKLQGGVANHYLGLKPYWKEEIHYNVIGKRSMRSGMGVYWLPWDILKFVGKIIFLNCNIIVLNPSLGRSAVVRDFIFLKISKFLRKKVVVFFHGWDQKYADILHKEKFVATLNKASLALVLADNFKKQLREWGVDIPIRLTTTKVDDRLLENFDIICRTGKVNTILFLARVEKEKGIYIALDVFKQLKEKYPYLKLKVVGDGPDMSDVRVYIRHGEIVDVMFTGFLSGDDLVREFRSADLYLFPSYHEGMPTSVLEAMAFGLPIITRPVGGLVDFFQNGSMGQMIDSFKAEDFLCVIERFLLCPDDVKKVSVFNHAYAKKYFLASKVAESIENMIKEEI